MPQVLQAYSTRTDQILNISQQCAKDQRNKMCFFTPITSMCPKLLAFMGRTGRQINKMMKQ